MKNASKKKSAQSAVVLLAQKPYFVRQKRERKSNGQQINHHLRNLDFQRLNLLINTLYTQRRAVLEMPLNTLDKTLNRAFNDGVGIICQAKLNFIIWTAWKP